MDGFQGLERRGWPDKNQGRLAEGTYHQRRALREAASQSLSRGGSGDGMQRGSPEQGPGSRLGQHGGVAASAWTIHKRAINVVQNNAIPEREPHRVSRRPCLMPLGNAPKSCHFSAQLGWTGMSAAGLCIFLGIEGSLEGSGSKRPPSAGGGDLNHADCADTRHGSNGAGCKGSSTCFPSLHTFWWMHPSPFSSPRLPWIPSLTDFSSLKLIVAKAIHIRKLRSAYSSEKKQAWNLNHGET